MMNDLAQELLSQRNDAQAAHLMRFFKTGKGQYGEGDRFLGVRVPQTRVAVRKHWAAMSPTDFEECIASEYHEIRLAALLALVRKFERQPSERPWCVGFYLRHTSRINNWDLVDLSCYALLGRWLLDKDRSLLYDLARPEKSLWENRIAIVSTMAFLRHGQQDDTYAIADLLLSHRHDLMHKAVGWLLREAGKRCGEPSLRAWLLPRYKTMPRTALRYAIERFQPDERKRWLLGEV